MESVNRAVVVMGRVPAPGRVKTRLARDLGDALASRLYEAFLLDVFDLVEAVRLQIPFRACFSVLLEDAQDAASARALVPNAEWVVFPQSGPTLGDRIEDARRRAEARHALVIGSDSPAMPPERLRRAFEVLEAGEGEVVLGPTLDGGYDLIAFSGPAPALLDGIPWSTEAVLDATRAAAARSGLRLYELDLGRDIDDLADLRAWLEVWAETQGPSAPRTRALARSAVDGYPQKPLAPDASSQGTR